jgi:hypothetical protein
MKIFQKACKIVQAQATKVRISQYEQRNELMRISETAEDEYMVKQPVKTGAVL